MLPLDSERWSELVTAYGRAANIPSLIRALEQFPPSDDERAEPYFSLWSALCHQGDVYSASFAAVPHLVRVLEMSPEQAPWSVFSLVSAIELARSASAAEKMPQDLSASYFEALSKVPNIAMRAAAVPWDQLRCRAILGCFASAKGQARLGAAIEELEPDVVEKLLTEWLYQ